MDLVHSQRRFGFGWLNRHRFELLVLILSGLFISAPFLTNREVGTGEAYNYSLASADFVSQVRHGTVPVLVGQSEYAWNGRIHPLRTAPYFLHAVAVLDLLTGRCLSVWTLQNLVLAASLLGAVFSFYVCSRQALPATNPRMLAVLAAAYGLAPGLLSTAYAMDLYMTVAAAPWIPVVLCGLIRAFGNEATFAPFRQLTIGLAAAWLAHPPVALWLTTASGLIIVVRFSHRGGKLRTARYLALAIGLFALLGGYAFISALTAQYKTSLTQGAIDPARELLAQVSAVFPASLHPVSAQANQLGDFQLGYAYWAGLLFATVLAVVRRQFLTGTLVAVAWLLLLLVVPIPGVTAWLWHALPYGYLALTNQWPMQRLYLLITALLLLALAAGWPQPKLPSRKIARDLSFWLLLIGAGWILWQSLAFVTRGFGTRRDIEATARSHDSGNIDLTVTSYAMLQTPGWFAPGYIDPGMESRLLAPGDAHLLASNLTAPLRETVLTGSFEAEEARPGVLVFSPQLTLEPGVQYRLSFDFLTPPLNAILQFQGPRMHREYALPVSGGPQSFGQQAGNAISLPLSTTGRSPETIELRLVAPGIEGQKGISFANFKLQVVHPDELPTVLESLQPLRVRTRAAGACYLETLRSFIPGYQAVVNGRPVPVQPSPDGLVMLPIPAGESTVTVTYEGPPGLSLAWKLTVCSWLVVVLGPLLPVRIHSFFRALAFTAASLVRRRWRPLAVGAAAIALLGLTVVWYRSHRPVAGAMELRVLFPRDFDQGTQPLLVTGKPFAGTFVYVRYVDPRHIVLGVDVWGVLGKATPPLPVDYFAEHRIIISHGALFPESTAAMQALSPEQRSILRNRVRVVLDGTPVIDETAPPFASPTADIVVGENRIGGSNAGVVFTGTLLEARRLPVSPEN